MPAPRHLQVACCAFAVGAALYSAPSQAQMVSAIPGSVVVPDYDPNAIRKFQPGRRGEIRRPADPSRGTVDARLLDPMPSGAGVTGFDSSGTGRRRPARKPRLQAAAPSHRPVPLGPVMPGASTGRPPRDSAGQTQVQASGSDVRGRQIVEPGPVYTAPRRRRVQHGDDPYAALGLRSGGLLFYPAVEFIGGRNSNPGQVPGSAAANFYAVAPELRVQSDWRRHAFRADLRGSYTAFRPDTTPALSRPYFSGTATGRIDVTHNDRIDLGARTLLATDNPGSPNLNAGLSRLPLFTTVGGNAGVARRFNRLEIAVRGDAERTVFENSKLIDGTTASNASRNYNQYGGAVRVSYAYFPGVTPFIEGNADTRRHDTVPDPFGFDRNSKGLTGVAGSTFELTHFLTGEIAAGYTRRNYDDARLAPLRGLIGNASLIWNASGLTTVRLTATSRAGESTVADVSGVLYRNIGARVDHAFRQWLIGAAKFSFGYDTYTGNAAAIPDRADKRYSAGFELTYKFNRLAQMRGEVRRDWLRSNVVGVDYTANIFLVGLRLQY